MIVDMCHPVVSANAQITMLELKIRYLSFILLGGFDMVVSGLSSFMKRSQSKLLLISNHMGR